MTHKQLHCQEISFPAILTLPYAIAPPRYIPYATDDLSREGSGGGAGRGGVRGGRAPESHSGEGLKKELSF